MDILTYINKMNRLYGSEQQVAGLSESFPGTYTSYNDAVSGGFQGTREEWLQQQSIPQIDRPFTGKAGGSVYDTRKYFKPGGLVEPGVTHYARRTQTEVEASKNAIRSFYNNAIKNKDSVSIKSILDNVSGSDDMMIRRVLNKDELAGLYKETKITAPETGKIQARKVAANQIKAYEAIAKNSNLTVPELAKTLKLTKKETNGVLSNLLRNIYKHRRELTTGETPPKKVGETVYRKLPPGKSSSSFLNDYKLDDVKKVLNSVRDNSGFNDVYRRTIYSQVLEAFEGKPKQLKEANRRLDSWFEIQKQFKKQYPKLYKDFKSGLDHPLSFKNLEAVGVTPENAVRLNPIPQKINIGIKAGLDTQYGKINALIRKEGATPELLKRKKSFEGLVKNLGLTMGRTGRGGDKVIFYGGENILKGDLGDKMIKNLGLKTTVYENIKKMEKAGTLKKAVSEAYGGTGSFYKSLQKVRPDDPKKLAQAETALKNLLKTAKNVKGSGKVKAVASIATLVGGYTADKLLKEHGISLTQDENEKVLEAGMFPGDLIKEHPVTSTLGAAATLRASKRLPGDPLKMVRKAVHTPVTWPLKKMIRSLGTPLSGAGFAGWQIYDNLKAGKSLPDAVVDKLVGAEIAFPSLFKENISKIIPDKYQNIAARTGRKVLGLGKVLPRAMGPVGATISVAGALKDRTRAMREEAKRITELDDIPEQTKAIEEYAAKDYRGYVGGGRVSFKLGGIDKGRRGFLKLLSALGITAAGIKTGLLKLANLSEAQVAKITEVIMEKAKGMPDWFPLLVNRVIKEGDDVTAKLATKEREIVHTKSISKTEDVTVYQNLDTGNVRVEYGPTHPRASNDLSTVHLEYRAPEEVVTKKGSVKTKSEFDAVESEPKYVATGPDDAEVVWDLDNVVGNVDDLTTDTSKLKTFATKKKLTHKDKVIAKKKQKSRAHLESDTEAQVDYSANKYGEGTDYDDYLPDIDDLD